MEKSFVDVKIVDVNTGVLSGNVGAEGMIVRYSQSGFAYGHFDLAVHDDYTDSGGVLHKRNYWVPISVRGPYAEIMQDFVYKGRRLMVVNYKLTTRTYKTDDGRTVKVTEVVVGSGGGYLHLLGGNGQRLSEEQSEELKDGDMGAVTLPDDDIPF